MSNLEYYEVKDVFSVFSTKSFFLIWDDKTSFVFAVQEQEILKQYEHDTDKKIQALQKFMIQQKDDLKAFDMNLVLQLDQKVADQQQILEQAGVPGFYVTSNTTEIKVQMHLLDFLLRLSRMTIPL